MLKRIILTGTILLAGVGVWRGVADVAALSSPASASSGHTTNPLPQPDTYTRLTQSGSQWIHSAGQVPGEFGRFRDGTMVRVVSVDGDNVYGTTRDGSKITVHISANTHFATRPGNNASRSDIKPGAALLVQGTTTNTTIEATNIVIVPPHVVGTVSAVTGSTFTVTAREGTFTSGAAAIISVETSSTTTYASPRNGAAHSSDVKVGTTIMATGTLSTDGKTLQAQHVMVLPAGGFGAGHMMHMGNIGPHSDGQVASISGDTITLKLDATEPSGSESNSATTILLTTSTQYHTWGNGASAANKDAIKVGSHILARGTLSSDSKTLTATDVIVLPSGAFHGGFGQPEKGPWEGGPPTQFQIPGGSAPSSSI